MAKKPHILFIIIGILFILGVIFYAPTNNEKKGQVVLDEAAEVVKKYYVTPKVFDPAYDENYGEVNYRAILKTTVTKKIWDCIYKKWTSPEPNALTGNSIAATCGLEANGYFQDPLTEDYINFNLIAKSDSEAIVEITTIFDDWVKSLGSNKISKYTLIRENNEWRINKSELLYNP